MLHKTNIILRDRMSIVAKNTAKVLEALTIVANVSTTASQSTLVEAFRKLEKLFDGAHTFNPVRVRFRGAFGLSHYELSYIRKLGLQRRESDGDGTVSLAISSLNREELEPTLNAIPTLLKLVLEDAANEITPHS